MSPVYAWPPSGQVSRLIPKDRLYSEARVTTIVKQRFVDEIQQVRWAFKLAEESTGLRPTDAVPEIQVFEVELKSSDVHDSVLTAIDEAIPSPIIFELRREDGLWTELALAAALKSQGKRRAKISRYFRTGWISAESKRAPLPQAISLEGLYIQILGSVMPYPLRSGEQLQAGIERMASIERARKDIDAIRNKIGREPQFNRKIELRRGLLSKEAELLRLTNVNSGDGGQPGGHSEFSD